MRTGVRRFLVDIEPLRLDRDYRWLWTGMAVSGVGNQITRLALPFQVYAMTRSTLAVAVLIAFQLVPILLFALVAGSIADAVDRRRLLLVTQTGLLGCSLALAVLAVAGDPPLAALYGLAFLSSALFSFDQPARASAVLRLVPPERLPAALALNQLNFQTASIVGPAIAGVLIGTVGLTGAYIADALTFLGSLTGILAIRPLPPLGQVLRPGLEAIRQGLAFVRSRREILGGFLIDLDAMILAMPVALFPAIALDVFHVGPQGLGVMAAAPAAGAFLAAVLSGWVGRVERVGRAVVLAVIGWGAAMTAFGAVTVAQDAAGGQSVALFVAALVMLAVAGGSDMLSAVFRNTMLQLATPDELRGRVTSIHALVVTSGPRIGDIQSSLVAAFIGPGQAVVAGGLLCLAGVAAVVRVLPELPSHVIRRRERSPDSEVRVVHQPDAVDEHEVPVADEPARRGP